jgi:hypothetical protein
MLLRGTIVVAQTDSGSTPELLRAHGSNINEQESTLDGGHPDGCGRRGLFYRFGTRDVDCVGHKGRLTQAKARNPPGPKNRTRPASACESYAATSTLIVRGLASSRNGSFTVSTPFLYSAMTFDASTVFGRVNERTKEP